MAKPISIAIDGPAGAGKSTIARRLAKELGFYYVDTGAIYRTVAYFFDLWGVSPKDIDGITRYIDELTIGIEYDDEGVQHMIMNGMDVTGDIRTPDLSQKASLVSAHAIVRDLLLDMQREMAEKHNVTFFSLETDSETVEDRIMAAQAGVDLAHIQSGNLDEAETVTLVEAKRKLADRNFHFYEATGVTVDEIRAVTCRNKSDIIVVDYLQLVRSSDPKHIGKEYETITEVTTALQRLAKSGVCVIALSQLSRGGEGMAALRGSGQIEQDADVVMLLDYPSEKDVESDEEAADLEAGRLRVIEIAKNKGGRRGSIPFWFCGSQQRFLAQWQGFYQSKLRMMEDDATA